MSTNTNNTINNSIYHNNSRHLPSIDIENITVKNANIDRLGIVLPNSKFFYSDADDLRVFIHAACNLEMQNSLFKLVSNPSYATNIQIRDTEWVIASGKIRIKNNFPTQQKVSLLLNLNLTRFPHTEDDLAKLQFELLKASKNDFDLYRELRAILKVRHSIVDTGREALSKAIKYLVRKGILRKSTAKKYGSKTYMLIAPYVGALEGI